MAEQTQIVILKGSYVEFEDDTGTKKTFRPRLGGSTITWTKAGFGVVRAMDTDGAYIGPARKGPQSSPAKISIGKVRVYDPGANATEAVAVDIGLETGYVGSTWTTTQTTSEFMHYTLKIFACDDPAGTAGTLYTWTDVMITPGSESVEITPEGMFLSMELECATDAALTVVT